MKIIAAIANGPRDPFEIEPCELSAPRAEEVMVRVHACGICHTDLAVKLGHIPVPMPKVLGHEGAGVIEEVGPGVTSFRPGDDVLMSFGSCGECSNCRDGALGYCDQFRAINLFGNRPGGSALRRGGSELGGHFFAQSAFATHAIATTRNIVKVDADLPLELLAPLGCGIQTGMGSVMNVLRPQAGTSIAVFGVGAVGLSAIIAARIVGCSTIVAVDVVSERLRMARELGATHAVSGRADDPVAEIVELTRGGANFSLETTGVPAGRGELHQLPACERHQRAGCGAAPRDPLRGRSKRRGRSGNWHSRRRRGRCQPPAVYPANDRLLPRRSVAARQIRQDLSARKDQRGC